MKKIIFGTLVFLGLWLAIYTPLAFAGSAVLTWQAPTSYADGTTLPLSSITAYTVYYDTGTLNQGTSPKIVLPITAQYPSTLTMSYTVTGLTPGATYNFAVTATASGVESAFSNKVSKAIPASPPSPPSGLSIPGGVDYL